MSGSEGTETTVLYREKQWVPAYWWVLAAGLVVLLTAQIAYNRSLVWLIIPAIVLTAIAVWVLLWWSSTVVRVERDADGSRWLIAGPANLPADVVSRCLAVPESAKRSALGPQFDPAAFTISHGWIREMVMIVLDDPEDPTPYWLISSKNPDELLRAFVPDLAEAALAHLPRR
ncbi:DUF3093 domain-containing protein [Corynebacterium uterequi]|uniref:Putative DUF3093 family protein n=1 Tax=Corynebacterium uterequi TaxID=1072256 RepID=A0A0G3HD21_9CORY|nr:DUF3093 domain-containing protein [Corynebacterium uterequi]AKK11261.1 putative DUF3093 family protein [Corynebacterium uterequi]